MATDPVLLARQRLFPGHGLPIHVNRPIHQGDVPLHRHDFFEIAVVCAGHALHRTIQGVEPVATGDVILLRPGHWHAYEGCRDLHLANGIVGDEVLAGPLGWVRGSAALAPFLGLGRSTGPVRVHLDRAGLARVVAALDALRAHQQEAGDLVLAGHLLLILGELAAATGPAVVATADPHPLVVASIDRMRADLAAPWTLAGLAHQAGVTPSYLVRLFRRFTGHTPLEWLARQRLEQAAVLLLTTDLTLTVIAREVGWMDATHLVRRFKAWSGQTPGAYRQQLPVRPQAVLADDWIQW